MDGISVYVREMATCERATCEMVACDMATWEMETYSQLVGFVAPNEADIGATLECFRFWLFWNLDF